MSGKKPIEREERMQSIDNEEQEFLLRLGARIKELRTNTKTSLEKFALHHDFGRSQYGIWEKGQNLTILSLRKIAKAHAITVSQLLEGIE